MDETKVLCGANSYEKKFYMNPEFSSLPEEVRKELQILCVLFTEDVGGILILYFDEEGRLQFQVSAEETDVTFDEIGSGLKIREIQRDKEELFRSLELFYRTFYLGEDE